MEENNQAINSSKNQQTPTTDTTLLSTMTTVTHPIASHIVDDFEPDPKCEITTLEKASYDCNEIMEKVIDNIVELGGCQQFVSGMEQREGTTNREEEVEHIQREIIGDRNPALLDQPAQVDHQSQDVNHEQEKQAQEQITQQEPQSEIPQHLESRHQQPDLEKLSTVEQIVEQKMQVDETTSTNEPIPAMSPPKVEQSTDLNSPLDTVPVVDEAADAHKQETRDDSEQESKQVMDVSESATVGQDVDEIVEDQQHQLETVADVDGKEGKIIIEEVVPDESIVEESVEEEIVVGQREDETEKKLDVASNEENKNEQVDAKLERAPEELLTPSTTEANTQAEVEKVDQVETSVETKTPSKRRGRKPKVEFVPEVPLERPRRTRGSTKPPQEEDQNASTAAATVVADETAQAKEKSETVEKDVDISHHEDASEDLVDQKEEVVKEKPSRKKLKELEAESAQTPEPEPEAEPGAEIEAEEPELKKSVRAVRASRASKRSFQPETPQEPEKKTVKKTKVERSDTFARGLQNPKLKLPARNRVTISTSRPATKPERRCDFDDFGFRKYRCDLCRFSTDRLNTIVEHQKSAVCEAAKRRYDSHVQESLHKLQSPKSNKKRYSR